MANNLEGSVPAQPVHEWSGTVPANVPDAGSIVIDPSAKFQTMAGIGAAFSEIGALAFAGLPRDRQKELLKNLFDAKEGAGFSMCRLPIGSSDFATNAYSYAETPDDYDMKAFSLARDEKSIIPLVQAAQEVNPDLKLFASPWSPPGWMKISGKIDGGGESNRLRDDERIYNAYAHYFEKYLAGYRSHGISISRLCPQNEMDCNPGYPGCVVKPEEMQRLVVKHLAPLFASSKVPTEIWAGTFRESPKTPWATECMKNEAFRAAIAGLGIQYFNGKTVAELADTYPGLRFMHTEASCENGKNTIGQAQNRFPEMIGKFTSGCDNYAYWNMLLDEKQKSGWGWTQNSLVTIDRPSGTVRYNPDFQPVCLVSRVIRPGFVRIGAVFQGAKGSKFSTPVAAFQGPKGEIVVLAQNRGTQSAALNLIVGKQTARAVLPANADCAIILESGGGHAGSAEASPGSGRPWLDISKPIDERVKLLVEQLTTSEKASLIYFCQPAIERLGIPAFNQSNECLHGVLNHGPFTVFPQAIGLAATFEPEAIHEMADAISDEGRAKWNATKGADLGPMTSMISFWTPVVNMARDPRWGRTQETYGEDPWLTSRMGIAFVKGLQGDDPHYIKAISTAKHFAGNNEEDGRFGKNIWCDERYLFEYEFFPFRACVKEADVQSIMAAYTSINGIPSAGNPWLLKDVLRKRWGFDGFVVSDCGAISHMVDRHHYVASPEAAIAASLNAGIDLEGGWYCTYRDVVNAYLPGALKQGLVTMKAVDKAVSHVLRARFRLGMFDPPDRVPYSKIPESVICSPEHAALARKLADKSIVLLKNDSFQDVPLLPINPARVKTLCVVGRNAEDVNLGDYAGRPENPVSPLQGIKARAEKAGIAVTSYPWQSKKSEPIPTRALLTPDGAPGLQGRYFSSGDLTDHPVASRIDPQLNFDWAHIQPDPLASGTQFSTEWTGKIKCPTAGDYTFTVIADGGVALNFDGYKLAKGTEANSKRVKYTFQKYISKPGEYPIKLEYHHTGGETGMVLEWTPPSGHDYIASLKKADLVVAVMGINVQFEIEGKDRKTLHLPEEQQEFLRKLIAVNPRVVLVTESGSPLAMPEANTIPAIVHAWYPGQQGGAAIADILFGDVNPAGRLPLTFYAEDSQLRPIDEYDLTKGRTYMYLEAKPAFPFGHGLSYTRFNYSNLKLSENPATIGSKVVATVDVTNAGDRDGDEVVQGYVTAPKSRVPMPKLQLWSFQRVAIPKGETKTVTLTFDTANFGHWDKTRQDFVVEPGEYDIQIGASSSDIRCSTKVCIK